MTRAIQLTSAPCMPDRPTVVPFTPTERERPADAPLRLAAEHLVKVYKRRKVVQDISIDVP